VSPGTWIRKKAADNYPALTVLVWCRPDQKRAHRTTVFAHTGRVNDFETT